MAVRLIVNADDFGLTPGINRAVAELHRAGVLSSATLMASGAAFADAVELARSLPKLGIGAHIVLVDGTPISDPASVATLLGPDGRGFRPTLGSFVAALLTGRIREEEIYREALAQLRRIQSAGIAITHVDTHKHTHLFARVARPLLQAAGEAGVSAIRNPFEPAGVAALTSSATPLLRRLQVGALATREPSFRAALEASPEIRTTCGTLGISATGSLNRDTLRALVGAAQAKPSGIYELCCHPGYSDSDLDRTRTRLREQREIERDALLAILPHVLMQPNAPALIHYGAL